jgi:hypothetical protein
MSETKWEPKVGEFVAVFSREYRSDRYVVHRRVARVTPQQVRLEGDDCVYRRPKPGRYGMEADTTRWHGTTSIYRYFITPAERPQTELQAEHDEAQRQRVLANHRRDVSAATTACTDPDRLTRALAILRGEA